MFCNSLLAVVMEEPAKHEFNQAGWTSLYRNPVGFSGEVEFNQRVSEGGQIGATEGNPASCVSRFEQGDGDQAGGIGQMPDWGNMGSPVL